MIRERDVRGARAASPVALILLVVLFAGSGIGLPSLSLRGPASLASPHEHGAGQPVPASGSSGPTKASTVSPSGSASPASSSSTCPISGVAPLARMIEGKGASAGSAVQHFGGLAAHSVDPQAVPNSAFWFNLTAYAMPSPVPNPDDTFLLSEEEPIGGSYLIMGLLAAPALSSSLTPFWAVLDNATEKFTSCGWSGISPHAGQVVSFEAFNSAGDTWEVNYQGQAFANSNNITMSTPKCTWSGGIGVVMLANWTGTPAWAPAEVNLTSTLRVLTSSGWYLPHPVAAAWNGTPGGPAWGEAGPVQLPYLAPGMIQIGTDVPIVTNGTELWVSSAPTPVTVTVTASPTTLSGGQTTHVVVHEVAARDVAIAGLSVVLSSSGGGSFSPAPPWTTNSTGIAQGNYTAPIVSSALNATLTAVVSSSLYSGVGNTTVMVAPTTLTVTLELSTVTLTPGATANITLRATLGGRPLRGPPVNLTLSANVGGGTISPAGTWTTNAEGYANGTYQVPDKAGPVELMARVVLTGYSGTGDAWLNVTGASTSSGSSNLAEEATVGVLVLVVGVVVALVLLTRGRRRGAEEETEAASPASPAPASSRAPEEPEAEGTEAKPTAPAAATSGAAVCPGCGLDLEGVDERFCPSCGAPVTKRGGKVSGSGV